MNKLEMLAVKRAALKELENEVKELESEIKSYMGEQNLSEYVEGPFKASYKEVISNRLDATAFRTKMPKMAERFMVESSSMRFTFGLVK